MIYKRKTFCEYVLYIIYETIYDDNKDNNITLCTLPVVFPNNKNIIIIIIRDDVLIENSPLSRYFLLNITLSPSYFGIGAPRTFIVVM